MIRIDEIYNHTFWPYIQKHIPLTRMFYCYPYGSTDPDNLTSFRHGPEQLNYTFFHDQEPIHLDIHSKLFFKVINVNQDLDPGGKHGVPSRKDILPGSRHRAIITSELDSDAVDQVCSLYDWRPYYYFFHGWAALDWYRGYNHSFLMLPPDQRVITKSFVSPNRIIGGKRKHRIDLMYLLLQRDIKNAHISFPEVCPSENIHINDLVKPEQRELFAKANLPWNFENETNHPMHSCWLSLFDQCGESLSYVVTETVYEGRRLHLTEKTFKPICLGMPFVLVSTAGSLAYLRSYGFKTFDSIWDESYDTEPDDTKRLIKIADLLKHLDSLSLDNKQQMFKQALPIIQHNFNHFYNGDFESVLWNELVEMLSNLARDFDA